MPEIAPNRSTPVKVLRRLLRAVAKAIQSARQRAPHLGLQLAFELLDYLPNDTPRCLQHLALQMAAKRKQRLEQLHVRLELFERLFVSDQFGQTIAIKDVLLHD